MIRHIVLLLLLVLGGKALLAQSEFTSNNQLALQANASLHFQEQIPYQTARAFSPSLQVFTPTGFRHEFEWSTLGWDFTEEEDHNYIAFRNAWRYGGNAQILKHARKWQWYLGSSVTFGQRYEIFNYWTASRFREAHYEVDFRFDIQASFIVPLRKNLYWQLTVPISIATLGWNYDIQQNPALPSEQQRVHRIGAEVLPAERFHLSFGLGYRL